MDNKAGRKEVSNCNDDDNNGKEEVFTKIVRAGKRTYFFDVKATRTDDFYLTITESKKRVGKEGKVFYEKHKIFLYKEDFEKFADGLKKVVRYIDNGPQINKSAKSISEEEINGNGNYSAAGYSDLEFDDLGKK